jgi:hypothetical protein
MRRIARIPRPRADECAGDVASYVDVLEGDDARRLLGSQAEEVERTFLDLPDEKARRRYAPEKWSVKEVVGHLCDAERVYAYRALRFARNDPTPLPGFDENLYVSAGRFDARTIADVVDEWRIVRAATMALFDGLDSAALARRGVANGHEVSVRALAWLAVGHAEHHLDVLSERYGIG